MIYLTDPTSHRDGDAIGNLGDCVIKDAISGHISELIPDSIRSSWVGLDGEKIVGERQQQLLLCGANILANFPYLNKHVWRPALADVFTLKNVVLFGVGWWKYQRQMDWSTRTFYQYYLSKGPVMHSVRDSYTRDKLIAGGLDNVINTGCPTMWNLPDFLQFSAARPDTVVFTLTDYSKEPEADKWMVEYLLNHYQRVVFFPQGIGDIHYLSRLLEESQLQAVEILSRSIDVYNDFLEMSDTDYVGTRLHGGIRALQKARRSIIVSVDNRAEVIAKDSGLPVVDRKQLRRYLPDKVDNPEEIKLAINREGIDNFKATLSSYLHSKF